MTADNPRQGLIYRPSVLAAAVPVYFHPLNDGRYLAILRERWIDATVGTSGPQAYSAYTRSTDPVTAVITPATGNVDAISSLTSGQLGARVLIDATSKYDSFYTLGTCGGVPLVQWFRVLRDGVWTLGGEELLPPVGGVSFASGCWIDGNFLVCAGVDASQQLYLARKRWGRIGTTQDTSASYTWEYRAARGWLADPTMVAPLIDTLGNIITTDGPVSAAHHRDRTVLVVVHNVSGARTPVGYVARDVDQLWRSSAFVPPSLGDDSGYAGGTLYLQSQLNTNPAQVPVGTYIGFPAVYSTYASFGDEASILTDWVMWLVDR